jgi:hypothetical protein
MVDSSAPINDWRIDRIMLDMILAKMQYLSSELADLRAAVTELQPAANGAPLSRIPSTVLIGAEEVGPFERGFYRREFDGTGRPFRWTGDGEYVELRFFIDRNVVNRFEIRGRLYGDASLGPVRVFVDYAAVPVDVDCQEADVKISGEIPPTPLGTRAVVTLWSPVRWVPGEASDDERSLWFAFYELRTQPAEEAPVMAVVAPAAAPVRQPNRASAAIGFPADSAAALAEPGAAPEPPVADVDPAAAAKLKRTGARLRRSA